MNQRATQTPDGVQADDAVPDGEQCDHEPLAVCFADVLRQHRRRLREAPALRLFGQLDSGLADQGDPESGDAVGAGWAGLRHGSFLERSGRGRLSLRPRPAGQAAAWAWRRYSSRIKALTAFTVPEGPATSRR